jgi:ribosomal protein S24E
MLLGVKKTQIGPQSLKTEFGAQNQYGRVIYPSKGNFTWSKKKHTFGKNKVSEPEKGTQAPKYQK